MKECNSFSLLVFVVCLFVFCLLCVPFPDCVVDILSSGSRMKATSVKRYNRMDQEEEEEEKNKVKKALWENNTFFYLFRFHVQIWLELKPQWTIGQ